MFPPDFRVCVTPNETPVRDETFRSVQERPSVAFAVVMPYASCVLSGIFSMVHGGGNRRIGC